MRNLILLFILIPIIGFGQNNELSIFENLVGKTWVAEGSWGDGSKFKQELVFKYSLDSTIVITNAIGFIDKEQTKLGERNHGIRQYDKESDTIKFWEFDVFGGLTKGIVFVKDKNIYYQYDYGGTQVTDMWEFVNDSTYNFKVGSWEEGVWKQVYLNSQFNVVEEE